MMDVILQAVPSLSDGPIQFDCPMTSSQAVPSQFDGPIQFDCPIYCSLSGVAFPI